METIQNTNSEYVGGSNTLDISNSNMAQIARRELITKLNDSNWYAIKFVLENLDTNFSLDYKALVTDLFKRVLDAMREKSSLENEQLLQQIEIVKEEFDKIIGETIE